MKTEDKGLSAWQLTMMAVGSVIGGSFFLGSSIAIKAAGPAVLFAYILGGILVYIILYAISELTVANQDSGSFRAFAANAFGEGAGFVVGWVYWAGLTFGLSSEATAISILIRTWFPAIPIAVLGSAVIIGTTLLNLLEADKLSNLESGFTVVKLLAIVSFIVIAIMLILGLYPGNAAVGTGSLLNEPLMPGGITSIAGSMLIIMFSYAGFEIIGLAAAKADSPTKTVPRAIRRTVVILIGLYILSAAVMLPLIPTANVGTSISPMVMALNAFGIRWAGMALNLVLVTAILSTMLATIFGLGRIIQSLAKDGLAPRFLQDKKDVPYRGIIFTGIAMLFSLGIGFLFQSVYVFLVSSGGFAMLFTYAVIMATHIRFRKRHGCPPDGNCQLWGFPYTSMVVLVLLVIFMISMPFVEGQTPGLIAGCVMVLFFTATYGVMKVSRKAGWKRGYVREAQFMTEASKELTGKEDNEPEE